MQLLCTRNDGVVNTSKSRSGTISITIVPIFLPLIVRIIKKRYFPDIFYEIIHSDQEAIPCLLKFS